VSTSFLLTRLAKELTAEIDVRRIQNGLRSHTTVRFVCPFDRTVGREQTLNMISSAGRICQQC
jgi:hypothetical protein